MDPLFTGTVRDSLYIVHTLLNLDAGPKAERPLSDAPAPRYGAWQPCSDQDFVGFALAPGGSGRTRSTWAC
jgi:hypothetical protein